MNVRIGPSDDLAACLALREQVFIEEQGVSPHEERDGQDAAAHHFLAHLGDQPVGTARILIKGDTGKIGRVCVLREARGTGLGAGLILACLDHLRGMDGMRRAQLGAQLHALAFYERLGFTAHGDIFDDAGIPHRMMERHL